MPVIPTFPLPSNGRRWLRRAAASSMLFCALAAADEASIRKNVSERFPKLPAIDEVSKTPVPGIYELRMGSDVMYSDEDGSHLIEGQLIDTKARRNLTEARLDRLSAFDFDKLPFKDAFVWKSGTGARRMAVFSDPNCSYCKRLEADLRKLKNVTIYTFLIPVLGDDSAKKSSAIWCAKDRTGTWLGWMLQDQPIPPAGARCDSSAVDRNLALSRKHRVNGTPVLVFSDNSRVAGAIGADDIEKQLTAAAAGKKS